MENIWPSGAMKQSGIYCIRNTVSGRRYVGSAIDIRGRWSAHRHLLLKGIHHSCSLLRSWLKHGETAFVFEILEIVTEKVKLIEREQYWINEFNSACPKTGFNMSPTAGTCLGFRHTDEARAKMSASRKGIKLSEEHAKHVRAALRQRNRSTLMRERLRASKLKLYASPAKCEQLRAQALKMWSDKRLSGLPLVRQPHTEEAKRKMSIAKKGKMSEAHKAAIVRSNKARWQTFGAAVK